MKYRSVQSGLIAISTICIAILLLAMFYYNKVQQKQISSVMEVTRQNNAEMIDNILSIKQEQANAVIHENSAWDELVDYIKDPEATKEEWIYENIGTMRESYAAADVLVFDTKGKMIYHNPDEEFEDVSFFPDIRVQKLFEETYKRHYFINIRGRVFEYFGSTVVSGNDIQTRKEAPSGYLFLIREVNSDLIDDYMKSLGSISIGLAQNSEELKSIETEKSDMMFTSRPLENNIGIAEAYMYFWAENTTENILKVLNPMLFIMFGIVLLMFASVWIYNRIYIIKPLTDTAEILKTENTEMLDNMSKKKTEFGMFGNSIREFLKQKNEIHDLYKRMEERNIEMQQQNEELTYQKKEIESQMENIKVLNLQIMERNKETERKNVQISVKNKQLEEQNENIRKLKSELEQTELTIKSERISLKLANTELHNNQNYTTRLLNVLNLELTPTKQIFKDFFVYSRPKNKIGGDFVLARTIDNWVIAGVGDCNMQGISGAVLSAIDLYLLNDYISIRKISELSPETILTELNRKIQSTMGEEFVTDIERDGLHLSLFMYNKNTMKGLFAASKRTMVIARRGETTEYYGDNLAIGKIHDERSFNLIPIQLQTDDIVYMYTDGCTEVVGGPYCKRLMAVNFKKEIAKRQNFLLAEQKNMFGRFYDEWIGDLDQSDDITMMVFKI